MNVIDSSGWLEYFADGPNATFFAVPIEAAQTIVPVISIYVISIYEVFKRVLQQRDEGSALEAVAYMTQGTVVELDTSLALDAAKLSVLHKLPMADNLILATARAHGATLWTQDVDFSGIEGVKTIEKP